MAVKDTDLQERVARLEAIMEAAARILDSIDKRLDRMDHRLDENFKEINKSFNAWLKWIIGLALANITASAGAALTLVNVLKR